MSTGLRPYRLLIVLLLLGAFAFAQRASCWALENLAGVTGSLGESIAGEVPSRRHRRRKIRPAADPAERVDMTAAILANTHPAELFSISDSSHRDACGELRPVAVALTSERETPASLDVYRPAVRPLEVRPIRRTRTFDILTKGLETT